MENGIPKSQDSWISLPANVESAHSFSTGGLASVLTDRVQRRIQSGEFGPEKIEYIRDVDFNVTKGSLQLSKRRLEMLRSLCQLWNIDFLPTKISSHRPFIGPMIVAAKRMIYPALRVVLKDLIHQQRTFNASVVALAVELANEERSPQSDSPSEERHS